MDSNHQALFVMVSVSLWVVGEVRLSPKGIMSRNTYFLTLFLLFFVIMQRNHLIDTQWDKSYPSSQTGYHIVKKALVSSSVKHAASEVIYTSKNNGQSSFVTFQASPLRYYDGKLVWRSTTNLKLNLLDVLGGSLAQVELEEGSLNTDDKSDRFFSEDVAEKITAFDVLVENAVKTKYPPNINKNLLNVIPESVNTQSSRFNKKV